jgi:hypothetical protein
MPPSRRPRISWRAEAGTDCTQGSGVP